MGEKKEMRDKALQVLVSLVNAEDEITFYHSSHYNTAAKM
jgi:hypothetical protein